MRGSTFLATTVLAGVLLAAAAAPTGAAGATLYVSGSLGTDAGNCTTLGSPCRTIGYAVQQAGTAAATIEVTTGTYTSSGADVVSVGPGQDVTLLGGWEATFTSRVGGSTISGGTVRRAISVAGGSLTLSRFTVSGGSATAGGGLLAGSGGTARIVETTFEQNSSTGDGGAIAVEGGSVALVDSTVATNHADGAGAGVYVSGAGSVLRASNATIASNSATSGGGIAVAGTANEAVFLADTLIGGNTGGPGGECATAGTSSLTSLGYNAIGSTIGCAVAAQTGDQFDIQLFLLPLGAYGGPTDTEPLQTKSPLVDAGNPAGCRDDRNALLTTDQRGEPRPATAFDACDIGAYELGVPANDDFASAQALPSSGGQATGTNIHASLESGEPEHAGDEGGASVWYSWTAPSSGDYQVDTSGSDFDTLLGVYEGPDVAHLFLPPVAQNDDASDTTSTSRACFPATAGHTYRIAVDGFGGDTGTIAVRVQPKPDATPCPIRPPLVTPTAPRVGDTVHAGGGVWVDEGAATHQWYRCQAEECDAIDGAVGMDYTVTSDDVGHDLRIDEIENGSISTSDPTGAVGIAIPAPAANGRVFWTTNRDGLDFEIYSMLADGSSVQRLTDRAGQDVEPQPSPDGTQVVFVRGNDIAVMNSDGSNVRDLGVQGAFPHWSPDGSTIAYVGGNEVHLIDPDGSNDRALAGGASHDLAWSPDASQIAYAAQVGGHDDIAVVGSDGRGLTDLTDTAGTDELSPAWSPDGTQLLFVRGTPPASGQIVVTDPADTSETTLATPGAVVDATWSPDGTKILFSTLDNGNSDLYTIEPDGTGLTRLTSDVAGDELAAWGARVSFPLTVSVGGNGTVSTSPSGSTFADGTTVALTPSPASGWTFAGWTGSCSGAGACTVTMLGPRAVGATFTAVPAPPPPSGGGGGGGGGGSGGSSGIPPDIHVAVSASASAPPPVGADLLWFVTVSTKNTGGSSDVKLDLTLPAGWTYDHSYADRGPGCVGAPPKLTCDVGFINGSASTNVQLFGKVAQAGDLALTATATSQQEPEFDPSDNTVTLTLRTPSPTPTPIPTPTPAPTPKPKPVPAPRVSGSPVVGATLRAVAPSGSRYRWQLCTVSGCRAIRGATKPTLKLVSSYAHKSVRVAVTRAGRTTYSRKIPVRARAAAR